VNGEINSNLDRTGAQPSGDVDTSFFSNLSVQGYVPASGRGRVSGTATGVSNTFQTVLHWHNNGAQYWANATDGKYSSPPMKPGTYTMKMYRNEFLVAQDSVAVTAGGTTTKNIVSSEPKASVIWRVGEFDGQPFEFRNGDKIERMHPSDVRMGAVCYIPVLSSLSRNRTSS
jgi:rhamnogalacturonan endolyase